MIEPKTIFEKAMEATSGEELLTWEGKPTDFSACDAEGRNLLHYACAGNRELPVIKFLLEHKVDVNQAKPVDGVTPLLCAALNETHPDVFDALVAGGADIHAKTTIPWPLVGTRKQGDQEEQTAFPQPYWDDVPRRGANALMLACARCSNPQVITRMLSFGFDVNEATPRGMTALMEATTNSSSSAAIVQSLLQAGACTDATIRKGKRLLASDININSLMALNDTALDIACKVQDDFKVFQLLLAHGANTERRNQFGDIPLVSALKYGRPVLVIKELLNATKAYASHHTKQMNQLLSIALSGEPEKNEEVLSYLMQEGANIHTCANGTALFIAINRFLRAPAFVRLLLDSGFSANERYTEFRHMTPLMLNAGPSLFDQKYRIGEEHDQIYREARENEEAKAVEIQEMLIARGADVNASDDNGKTVLMYGMEYCTPCVESLLEHGADPLAKDHYGNTLVHYGFNSSRIEEESISAVVKAGCPIDLPNNYGDSPLYNAMRYGTREMVRKLLVGGADAFRINKRGRTPLMLILDGKAPHMKPLISLFTREGAGPRDHRRVQAELHEAIKGNCPEVIPRLVELGSNLEHRDTHGKTPLLQAVEENPALVSYLIELGADPTVKDAHGCNGVYLTIKEFDRFRNAWLDCSYGEDDDYPSDNPAFDHHLRLFVSNLALFLRMGADNCMHETSYLLIYRILHHPYEKDLPRMMDDCNVLDSFRPYVEKLEKTQQELWQLLKEEYKP